MWWFTGWDFPVVETGVADPHRCEAPASLWDGPGFWGAGVAEALPAGTAVVLGVVGLELFCTFMAFLHRTQCHTVAIRFCDVFLSTMLKLFFFQIQLLSYIPGWGSWVSSKRERSGRWARRWQLWQAWRWVQTRTEKCIWLHPATSGQRCCCLSESRQTEQKPDRYSRVDRYK